MSRGQYHAIKVVKWDIRTGAFASVYISIPPFCYHGYIHIYQVRCGLLSLLPYPRLGVPVIMRSALIPRCPDPSCHGLKMTTRVPPLVLIIIDNHCSGTESIFKHNRPFKIRAKNHTYKTQNILGIYRL
jgi:hypothetical protein